MKKILFSIVALVAILAISNGCSCTNDGTPWGVEYSLQSDGKTDASVSFTFVNGAFNLNGDANYVFDWSNTKKLKAGTRAYPLTESLVCNNPEILEAAKYVDGWLDQWFKVTASEGHYDIYLKGYVKETKTQITFSIDRHFTNIEEE